MQKPKSYNIQPARGQALLSFQGRRFPDKVELFETEVIEEVRQKEKQTKASYSQENLNDDFRNLLIHGDALSACAYLKEKNIKLDLVYIDPPFASGADYAKKLYVRNGNKEVVENEDNTIGEEVMYGDIWQKEDYLNWLYERLLAIRESMKEEANIYVHLDWHIGHYAKLLLDEVFGEENFINEIIWQYEGPQSPSDVKFGSKHDTILRYAKDISVANAFQLWERQGVTKEYSSLRYDEKGAYRIQGIGMYSDENIKRLEKEGKIYVSSTGKKYLKYYFDQDENGNLSKLKKLGDVWADIASLAVSVQTEKVDYSTQKPERLIARILEASSEEGMVVADFFVGSGTTAKVANNLGRKFIACDVGVNAIQTTRDRLTKAGAEFDILKVKDGVRLFRNPAQTTAKIFSLIDGFKSRKELDLSEFWDGGIADNSGEYIPVKCVGIDKRLTRELLDIVLEEIYQLQDSSTNIAKTQLIYAYKDEEITQSYINKQVTSTGKTQIKVELVSLDELLASKRDMLFMPDSAEVEMEKEGDKYKVTIKKFYSPYLKTKIDDYNNKKVKKTKQTTIDEEQEAEQPKKKVTISDTGLELIEAVQFDTTMKEGVWSSNLELEDKAGVKEKIKGEYILPTDKFLMKIRNIAGDEITIESMHIH
jgi:adenine-specific DNA-methyltransferase